MKGAPFGAALNFDQLTLAGHHQVQVDLGPAVLGVVEVAQDFAVDDSQGHARDLVQERPTAQHPARVHFDQGIVQSDPRPADGGRARAAIGLQHVAVEPDRAFGHTTQVDHAPQRAADQALDFDRAPIDPPGSIAGLTSVGGGRKHRVLGRHPTLALADQPARDGVRDRGRAEHDGVAEAREHRPGGLLGVAALKRDGACFRSASSVAAVHENPGRWRGGEARGTTRTGPGGPA